jgi:enoyl-[acyl-carrier protein] reductase I
MTTAITKKVALIMGVANQRSIALSCMESFLQKGDWDVILTVQNEKARIKVQKIIEQKKYESSSNRSGKIIGVEICDVSDQMSTEYFFRESLQDTLHNNNNDDDDDSSNEHRNLQAVIHSLAFAPDLKNPLIETTRDAYLEAHEISAYSLIRIARESIPYLQHGNNGIENSSSTSSLTTLSYLGAGRAIPGYNVMGPAKASLESIVRGLALELGQHDHPIRVNAVRAGPIPTVSSKGGIAGFERMRQDVQIKAPLGNVTASQVAATVYHVAAEACGMTGQTIEVDGGYSIVAGPSS